MKIVLFNEWQMVYKLLYEFDLFKIKTDWRIIKKIQTAEWSYWSKKMIIFHPLILIFWFEMKDWIIKLIQLFVKQFISKFLWKYWAKLFFCSNLFTLFNLNWRLCNFFLFKKNRIKNLELKSNFYTGSF